MRSAVVVSTFALALVCSCGSPSAVDDEPSGVDAGPGQGSGPSPDGGGVDAGGDGASLDAAATGSRDWSAYPAIVDVPAPATLWALSDVHGGYDRLTTLLSANGLLAGAPASPSAARWGAGSAVLVVAGDMIDKGPMGLEVLDLFMALEADAKAEGGRVIVTLGNHEAEFLVDPTNAKAAATDGIDPELSTKGVSPASLASGADPRGAWLRRLPFGARVGGWFFSHAGDTHGRTVAALEAALEAAVSAHPSYDDPDIVGATSILESRDWYTSASTVASNAAALGVKHIVFGHDPHALGADGKIAVDATNVLLRIDCGMSPDVDYSTGMLLRVTRRGVDDVVEQLDASGKTKALFAAPQ